MNTLESTSTVVRRILREVLEDESLELRGEESLIHDLGLDSMTFLHLALQLEDFLQAPLNEDPENLPETVNDLILLVQAQLEAPAHVA